MIEVLLPIFGGSDLVTKRLYSLSHAWHGAGRVNLIERFFYAACKSGG